jgi:TrmH family RNA methyltransferase
MEERVAPEVRKYLPLKQEKGRYRASRFLIEGVKNITDVINISPQVIYAVLAAEGFDDADLAELLRKHRIRVQVVHPRDLAALSDTEAPQGIIAVANFAALKPDWNAARYVILLDGIQDPGNVGAILRTSAAFGMDAVVLGKGTCDAYNPKVVRSSAACLLRLPLESGEDLGAKIHFLRTKGFSVVATSPHAKLTLEQAKLRRKVALLFGNEGAGVGENLLDQADARVRIPMRGKVESLNVAVSHGLLTHELLRVRGEL